MRGFPMAMVAAGLALTGSQALSAQSGDALPKVNIHTALGDIVVEVYPDRAPVSATNFLRYVDQVRRLP